MPSRLRSARRSRSSWATRHDPLASAASSSASRRRLATVLMTASSLSVYGFSECSRSAAMLCARKGRRGRFASIALKRTKCLVFSACFCRFDAMDFDRREGAARRAARSARCVRRARPRSAAVRAEGAAEKRCREARAARVVVVEWCFSACRSQPQTYRLRHPQISS